MAIVNNNAFDLFLKIKDKNNPTGLVDAKAQIAINDALVDPSGLLLSFKTSLGLYVYHNGVDTRSEMAKKIQNFANKASDNARGLTGAGIGGAAGLTKDKNTAIVGGIVGLLVGYSLPKIVEFFDNSQFIQEGYYKNGQLASPGKLYVSIEY